MGSRNPWSRLPNQLPYVLAEEESLIQQYNFEQRDQKKYAVRLELMPEPFLGDAKAPIIVLGLNPGFNEKGDKKHHSDQAFLKCARANLLHKRAEYPFYLLNPEITQPGEAGRKWWDRILGPWIEEVGSKIVARNVFCVEYFPYHSRRFKHSKLSVPSQIYSFSLVEDALDRNAIIIVLRGERHWFKAVPRLETFKNRYEVNSKQNPTISQKNCPKGFILGLKTLQKLAKQQKLSTSTSRKKSFALYDSPRRR